MDLIGLWVIHKHNHKFQTLIFNIDEDKYNAIAILHGKIKHVSNASALIEDAIEANEYIKSDDWSDFNDIAKMKKKQVIRRLFSPNPSNVDDYLRAKI